MAALRDGKLVPKEVLADYPDLQKPSPEPKGGAVGKYPSIPMTAEERNKLAGKQFSHCTFAIAEYRATTYGYMYPAQPSSVPVSPAFTPISSPNLELDFA